MSSKQTQKTESSTGTPKWMEGYWQNLFADTDRARASVDRSPFTGRVVAGRNEYDDRGISGMDAILGAIGGPAGQFTGNVRDIAAGKFLDPSTNPTLRGTVDAAQAPILEHLSRVLLPQARQDAVFQNAFGADRSLLREGQAIGDTTEALGHQAAQIYGDNYNRERQLQVMAPELMQSAVGAETLIPQLLMALGGQERGLQQLDSDNAIALRQLNAMLPFLGLGESTQIFGASPFSTSTSTTTSKTQPNVMSEILKGGLGAASLASGFGWLDFLKPKTDPSRAAYPGYF